MKVVIDRIEGEFAVLEVDGVSVDWPLKSLPVGTRECLRVEFPTRLIG